MNFLFINIKKLCQVETTPNAFLQTRKGAEMNTLHCIENAFLYIQNGKIADFGTMQNCTILPNLPPQTPVQDLQNQKMILPTFCDSHTHLIFAGSRETEFVQRLQGLTYEQIAESGGGILNSAKKLQQTPENELFETAHRRLIEVQKMGTGAIEIKSGYGLTTTAELKMLRVAQQLKNVANMPVKVTFLGAHAIPQTYKNNRQAYINLIINEMLPNIAAEKLADYIDVFCDKGFFTPTETAQILQAGAKYELIPKIHANELALSGGIQVGVQHKALSVDHLEFVEQPEIDCLLASNTMPTLLPTTAFFLGLQYAPARKMIDAGLPVAIASDYNPGSSPSGSMPFAMSLACIKMKMLPNEALNAATLNSAYALNLQNEVGSIAIGKRANIFISHNNVSSLAFLPYSYASNYVERVMLNGQFIL